MISVKPLAFFLVILGFILNSSQSLRFDLLSGEVECISEDMKINALSVGQYHVTNPNAGKVSVRVTSAYGTRPTSYYRDDDVEAGHFSFKASETGGYMACFWASEPKPAVTLTVDLVWKTGVAAKDWEDFSKKGSMEGMELELKKLMDTVSGIHYEMVYLRDREMQTLNKLTNSRIGWWRTGVAAKDWVDVAKKGLFDAMELELKKLMDTVSGIHDKMVYLRDREMRKLRRYDRRDRWRTGVAAKDWVDGAKKGSMDTMELELKKLMDTVSVIHDKMVYLCDREMQTLNRLTNSTSVGAKDRVDDAKKGSIDAMELELKKLMDTVSGINDEMVRLRIREMQTVQRITNHRIFRWKTGVVGASKDLVDVINKGSIDAMELELKNLIDTVIGIHDEMVYLRDREMQTLKSLTNSRIFWWKTGVAAEDWTDFDKGSFDAMELELKKLMDTVSGILNEMVYLRDREMQKLNRLTYSRIFWGRTGVAAKDWVDDAKKGSIDVMELEFKKLMDTVIGIHDEMVYLRDRVYEM